MMMMVMMRDGEKFDVIPVMTLDFVEALVILQRVHTASLLRVSLSDFCFPGVIFLKICDKSATETYFTTVCTVQQSARSLSVLTITLCYI